MSDTWTVACHVSGLRKQGTLKTLVVKGAAQVTTPAEKPLTADVPPVAVAAKLLLSRFPRLQAWRVVCNGIPRIEFSDLFLKQLQMRQLVFVESPKPSTHISVDSFLTVKVPEGRVILTLTILRKENTPAHLQTQWVGHSSLEVTNRYDHTAQEVEYRREMASKVGLGFAVIGPNGPN